MTREQSNAVGTIFVVFVAAMAIFGFSYLSLRADAQRFREQDAIDAIYRCLEPDKAIPGRCSVAAHKVDGGWRFEEAP